MLNITLQQMKYALEVYRSGSISQASRALYMNQPNLSRSIKELESELGITLFVRTSKGIQISKEGMLFIEYAESILQKLDELETVLSVQKQNNAPFNISIPRASYITYAFTRFINQFPDASRFSINFRETNSSEAITNLLSHGFDLGIARYTLPCDSALQELRSHTELSFRKIWEAEYVLIFSRQHPLADASTICLSDLSAYTELIHGDEKPVQTSSDLTPSKQISLYERGSQFDFLRNVPSTYMWVSPIPEDVLTQNELVQKKCNDSHTAFCDLLITRSGYSFNTFSSSFLQTLEQICAELSAAL